MGSGLKIFYVYALFRPNGVPCYIGKGKGKRWLRHEQYAKTLNNKHLGRIIINAGGLLPKIKLRENLTESDAFETEVALIAAIGRGKNGPLVNLTDGGDGVSGFIQSPEARRNQAVKTSLAMKGRPLSVKHVAALKKARSEKPGFAGKKHSEETKAKQRVARFLQMQEPLSDETRARMRDSWRKRTDLVRNERGQYERTRFT